MPTPASNPTTTQVGQLHSIVQQQARVLEALAEDDDDYNSKDEEDASEGSDGAEFSKLDTLARAAENKVAEPEVTDAEANIPDEKFEEPTEDEERSFQATKPWLGVFEPAPFD